MPQIIPDTQIYPRPPWNLTRLVFPGIAASWWEVLPDTFVLETSFGNATNLYRNNPGVGEKRDFIGAGAREEPCPLRDFEGNYYEVVHGWTAWAEDREHAEAEFIRHQKSASELEYGQPLVSVLPNFPVIDEVPKKNLWVQMAKDRTSEPSSEPLKRYVSGDGTKIFWEIVPGRVIRADTERGARERFSSRGRGATWSIGAAVDEWNIAPMPDEPKKVDVSRTRRFKDKDGDKWWLLDPTGEGLIRCAPSEEVANREKDDAVPVDQVMCYGPFRELDDDENVIATYTTAVELLVATGQPNEEDTDEVKENPIMTATRQPPPFISRQEDASGRNWYEVSANRWVLVDSTDTPEQEAQDAWRRFAERGYEESTYGRSFDGIRDNYGPMKDKGFVELKVVDKLGQADLVGSVLSHERCRCPKLEGEEEQDKQICVDHNTFCVDCGKLRP